jgi:peptidyl-tRNA hydrolase
MKDYVLSDFGKQELKELNDSLISVVSAIDDFSNNVDFVEIMNRYNSIKNESDS